MFGAGLFDRCVEIIKQWEPKKKYSKEPDYRDDLMDFLNDKLNSSGGPILGSLDNRTIKIKREASRSLCDIGVGNNQVGIELKRNLKSKSQINRLQGQIEDYENDYKEGVIVVLVGKTGKYVVNNVRDKLQKKLDKSMGFGMQQFRIKLINKSFNRPESARKTKSPFDLGI